MSAKINQTFQTKNDLVYNALKEQIVTGEIMPGERITVMQCAEKFGVSAMPVREALKRLQQEGLVKITPHAGAQVIKCDNRQFSEIVEIRNLIEPYAAKLATLRLTEKDFRVLDEMMEEMQACADTEDTLTYSDLNFKFHHYVYDRCGNETLVEMINSLWERSRMSRNIFLMERDRIVPSLEEHRKCLECLKNRDPEAVQAQFAYHKKMGFRVVERGLERLN